MSGVLAESAPLVPRPPQHQVSQVYHHQKKGEEEISGCSWLFGRTHLSVLIKSSGCRARCFHTLLYSHSLLFERLHGCHSNTTPQHRTGNSIYSEHKYSQHLRKISLYLITMLGAFLDIYKFLYIVYMLIKCCTNQSGVPFYPFICPHPLRKEIRLFH